MDKITIESIKHLRIQNFIEAFTEIVESGKSKHTCRIEGCCSSLSSDSAAIRHLRTKHGEYHKAIAENKSKFKLPVQEDEIEFQVKVSPSYIWDAILQLTIFNGLAFATVIASGFKKLVYPIIAGLKSKNIDLTINTENLKSKLKNRSDQMKDYVRQELKGNIVSLMLDIATRHNRAIFGINVAFFDGNEVQIRTLAMYPIRMSHTANNLFKLVKEILAEYNIRIEQIIAVTTDNARNLKKMTRLMNEDLMKTMRDITSDDLLSMFNGNIPSVDDELDGADENESDSEGTRETYDEYSFDPEIFDTVYFTDLLVSLRGEIQAEFDSLINNVPCAAHTINLVVAGAIESCLRTNSMIEKARKLVKKLRTPTLRNLLEIGGRKMSLLDVPTRWSSVYTMVGL